MRAFPLPMNPLTPSLSPSEGERVPEGRVRGKFRGSMGEFVRGNLSRGRGPGCTAVELSSAAGPHWRALNLNPNRNLARLRFLEIKSKITIKIGKKQFCLNSMAVGQGV